MRRPPPAFMLALNAALALVVLALGWLVAVQRTTGFYLLGWLVALP